MHLSPSLFTLTSLFQLNSTQAVSPAVLSNLRLFAQYSAAAYCPDNYLVPFNGSVICPSSVCPSLPTIPNVQLADSFIKVSFYHTTGLLLVDHTNNLIVVSFQGTDDSRDWLDDLDFLLKDAHDICSGCEAHSGFLGSWRGVRGTVLPAWISLTSRYPTYQTVATGHSLGAAIATLCAAQMTEVAPGVSISLYTYGSPRVGNHAFAQYIETSLGQHNYRSTHLNDPIPRLPPEAIGFQHPGPEYHLTNPHIPDVLSANSSTLTLPANLVVNSSDVQVYASGESNSGNDKYFCVNPAMHDEYLGFIAGCLSHDFPSEGECTSHHSFKFDWVR